MVGMLNSGKPRERTREWNKEQSLPIMVEIGSTDSRGLRAEGKDCHIN